MKIGLVTIPFSQADYLEQCMQSVLAQNYDNLEYIIVDPGSIDGGRDIIERYKSVIAKVILSSLSRPKTCKPPSPLSLIPLIVETLNE